MLLEFWRCANIREWTRKKGTAGSLRWKELFYLQMRHSQFHFHTFTVILLHFCTFTFTLSLSHFHFHTFTFTLSLLHFHFHTFTFALSLSHFYFHTFTFSLSLSHFNFHTSLWHFHIHTFKGIGGLIIWSRAVWRKVIFSFSGKRSDQTPQYHNNRVNLLNKQEISLLCLLYLTIDVHRCT